MVTKKLKMHDGIHRVKGAEYNAGQQPHAPVTRTARTLEPECDNSNRSAVSQASSSNESISDLNIFQENRTHKITIWICP